MSFALLSGSGAQTRPFSNPTVIPTGNWPAAVYAADLNADGIPDLIYIDQGAQPNQPTTAHILLGSNKAPYTQSAQVPISGNALAIADFDGDGIPDLAWAVVTGSNVQAMVASGHRDGTFSAPAVFGTVPVTGHQPAVPVFPTAVQFQDSGHPYLFVEDQANLVLYFLTDRKPTGVTLQSGTLPNGMGPILPVRLLGSAHQQYAILSGNGSLDLYFPDGAGALSSSPKGFAYDHYTGAGVIRSALFQDVTADGRPDLIAEGTNGRIDVYPGNGDGTFGATSAGGTGTLDGLTGNGGHLIAIADLNHDGQPDALTSTPIGVSSLLGQGTAYLGLKGIFNAGPGMHSFATADFNGDGNLDLATDSPEGIAILYGNGDGTFQTNSAYAAGAPAQSGTLGVFTQSGHLDAVVALNPEYGQVLAGQGDGTFVYKGSPGFPQTTNAQAAARPQAADVPTQILSADITADGKPDLILTGGQTDAFLNGNQLDGLQLQYGQGDGTFAAPILDNRQLLSPGCTAYPLPGEGFSVTADFDGDGTADVATRTDDGVHIFFGAAPGRYRQPLGLPDSSPSCDLHAHQLLAAGRLGPSSRPDLVVQRNGSLLLFANGGATGFSQQPLGDLSIDGSLTTRGQRTAPDISATFGGLSQALGFHAAVGSMLIADLDGDGQDDLLVAYDNFDADHTAPTSAAPNYLYLWFGDGTGHFPVSAKHPVNPVRLTPSRNFYQAAVTDVNQDGHPDLLLSDGYVVSVQLGDGSGSFGAERHFLAGQGINSLLAADLRGTGRQDLVLANGGTVLGNPVANREVLTANPDVNTGGITVLLNAGQTASPTTSGTFTALPEPSAFEAAVTLTTTLNPNSGVTPTGSINYLVSGTSAGTSTLSGGSASLTLAAPFPAYLNGKPLLPGTYPLTAIYSGDANYGPATLTASHTVLLGPTSVVLTPTTPLQSYFGQPIDGTFSVSVVDSNYGTTGTYTLFDNGVAVPICTNLPLTLNGKPLACPYGNPIFLDAGTHAFSIVYNGGPGHGDPVNDSSAASNTITYVALPDVTVAGLLTTSLNPSIAGQSVTFSAAFTSNVAVPTGQVRFLDGATMIGTGRLGTTGVATLTTSTLAIGSHPITAVYDTTTDFTGAVSATLNQVVLAAAPPPAAPFSLTVSPNPITLGVGRTAVLLVTVTGPLASTLTCTDSFTESACTFSQSQLAAGGGASTLQVSTAAPHDCSDPAHPYLLGPVSQNRQLPGKPAALLAALAACTLLARKRRRLAGLLFAFAGLFALSAASGCGHCTDLGTRPGSYRFTVQATASDGSTLQVTVPVTVKIPGE